MRMRGFAAAVAGVVGAASAHALDAAGLLPGVHETVAVRQALGPLALVAWLALAAALAWLASVTRPVLVGGAAAVVVSAVPELVGRHDPGAIAEPGALAGALVQWLLLMAVLALVLLVDDRLSMTPFRRLMLPALWPAGSAPLVRGVAVRPAERGRPRAPPAASSRPVP